MVNLTIDGQAISVKENTTIMEFTFRSCVI